MNPVRICFKYLSLSTQCLFIHLKEHTHSFHLGELLEFNASHTIHHLSFGEPIPNVIDPLDSTTHVTPYSNLIVSCSCINVLTI